MQHLKANFKKSAALKKKRNSYENNNIIKFYFQFILQKYKLKALTLLNVKKIQVHLFIEFPIELRSI